LKPWKTLSRKKVLQHGPFLTVEVHEVQISDGSIIPDWSWVITPDYVNVFAETQDGRFLCFRQTKYAVEGISLAPVGGFVDPGEEPEVAARRELLEETGYSAPEWIPMGSYAVDANRGSGTAHFFMARNAKRVSSPSGGDLEQQELLLLSREEIERALSAGEFKVLAWASVVALGLRCLG
jgi:ADP-ribose pyrophosphatase